jgi:hypothetical protein
MNSMTQADQLRLKDLRAIYRLIGECRELGSDAGAWRPHMLEGLRQLVGAQVGLCLQMRDVGTEAARGSMALDVGFLDARERALWARYQRDRAHLDDPFHLGFFGDFTGPLRTRRLESAVDTREWYRSRHYSDYVRACRLDDRITSALRMPGASPSTVQILVLHRSAADGKYSRRAQRLVHLFHHELGTLLGRQLAMPDANGAARELPFRMQQVLACLLEGDSEKQIATRLNLSHHTVNRHVQRLYREFDVHSRGELMFRCRDMLPRLALF